MKKPTNPALSILATLMRGGHNEDSLDLSSFFAAAEFCDRDVCGNKRHPRGAWHDATPLPMFTVWAWRSRLLYWWRTKRWGCGCAP